MATAISLLLLLLLLFLFLSTPTHQTQEVLDDPITRFQAYLRINTAHPTPDYSSAVAFLRTRAAALGLDHRTLEFFPGKPLLLLTWRGSHPSLPSLLLNSHLDSVPAEAPKWAHPPFSAVRAPDGRIFARGAQDDKCIATQYLEAIGNLIAKGFRPIRTVHVSFVPDEETGGLPAAAFAASEEFRALNIGFGLDEGQANPGDEFRVFYGDRIPWNLVIRAHGLPGHGSRMFDGSAAENLMRSVEIITRFRNTQFDVVKAGKAAFSDVVSVNPVYLKAGITTPTGFVMNMQPSEAEAGFNLRFPPTVDPDQIRKRIADEWAPPVRNMSYKITENGPARDYLGHPLMTIANDSNPWWTVFKKSIEAVGGKLAKPEILSSTTDARFIRRLGIPVLGFSPMSNTPILLHEHNEFLQDTVYLRGIEVYESIISALSSFEPDASQ